jgi:hypothetical protein
VFGRRAIIGIAADRSHALLRATERTHPKTVRNFRQQAMVQAASAAENGAHPEKTGPSNLRCMNTISSLSSLFPAARGGAKIDASDLNICTAAYLSLLRRINQL